MLAEEAGDGTARESRSDSDPGSASPRKEGEIRDSSTFEASGKRTPQLHPNIRENKPQPASVIVLSFGSCTFRYGFAIDPTPRKIPSIVAFPRKREAVDRGDPPVRAPGFSLTTEESVRESAKQFDSIVAQIADDLDLNSRRIGGGKPIPWDVEVEILSEGRRNEDPAPYSASQESADCVLVGRDADRLLREGGRATGYDVVAPLWDGRLVFGHDASDALVRAALDELLRHVAKQLLPLRKSDGQSADALERKEQQAAGDSNDSGSAPRKNYADLHIALVVPDTSDRRDVAEIVEAIFRVDELKAGAVFIHQSSVACALGAGLATCSVVDIGHSGTTVACVEEGTVCGESRVHLEYGAYHMLTVFERFLCGKKSFQDAFKKIATDVNTDPNESQPNPAMAAAMEYDRRKIVIRTCEQVCGFKADENDRLAIAMVTAPSGHSLRVKCGAALRAIPAFGLITPELLQTAVRASRREILPAERSKYERNADDDNFLDDLFAEMRRSAAASAALPIGRFANEPGRPGFDPVAAPDASIVDAVIWSIGRAVRASPVVQQQPSRSPELHRRFLSAIVLSGGGASLDGIALTLENKIKDALTRKGNSVTDVTIIDGGKGKGDEELAAAAALLRDQSAAAGVGDDTDTASLPWKGCAVMVEADAIRDYWLYRDDWQLRHVRALRERVPFYW